MAGFSRVFWSGRSDSNTRPLAPHASFPKPNKINNILIIKDFSRKPIDFDWCKLTKTYGFDSAKTRLTEEFCSSFRVFWPSTCNPSIRATSPQAYCFDGVSGGFLAQPNVLNRINTQQLANHRFCFLRKHTTQQRPNLRLDAAWFDAPCLGLRIPWRPQKLSATPDLSGTVLPLCLTPNSALKSAPPLRPRLDSDAYWFLSNICIVALSATVSWIRSFGFDEIRRTCPRCRLTCCFACSA